MPKEAKLGETTKITKSGEKLCKEVLEEKAQMKRCAILGSSRSVEDAPFFNEGIEIWSIATILGKPRYDRLFEFHDGSDRAEYENMLKVGCPVYMKKVHPEIPSSVEYPINEIVTYFGRHFSNSISYMIALAIYEGYQEILLYGVNMEWGSEYEKQKPSVDYLVGWARGAGIGVYVPDDSDIAKTHRLYMYESTEMEMKLVKRREYIADQANILAQQERHFGQMKAKHDGGVEMIDYVLSCLFDQKN